MDTILGLPGTKTQHQIIYELTFDPILSFILKFWPKLFHKIDSQDFHEMSLKRHIKDMHFRSQNTYVICPQCGKQYASQNSLYSHLNRVHGYKKDMMAELQLQVSILIPT
jgi:uncharacterized C2H2 Zn-finger protein